MTRPNILFLMTDQMQGRVLDPDNPCQTPHLDRLAARGVRFRRAYTPNAVCSPARGMGKKTDAALTFLDTALAERAPWCCFVSLTEPHDPFFCHGDAFAQYDVESIPLPPNLHNDLSGQPNLYKRCAQVWSDWTEREHREAAACYYASISEIDQQFGRLLERVEGAGQLEDTIVVLTSDHGDFLGAHGLYCKNIGAFEEAYNIPLVMAGPGVVGAEVGDARVGLQDVGQTLLELTGAQPLPDIDGRSFAPVLASPHDTSDYQQGFAEYFGGRYIISQRLLWDGDWKLVHNGFDYDELYNLADDPAEMNNLAQEPACAEQLQAMTRKMWQIVVESGDHSLYNTHYPSMRIAAAGPG